MDSQKARLQNHCDEVKVQFTAPQKTLNMHGTYGNVSKNDKPRKTSRNDDHAIRRAVILLLAVSFINYVAIGEKRYRQYYEHRFTPSEQGFHFFIMIS